jgi:FxLD family lantipeptide
VSLTTADQQPGTVAGTGPFDLDITFIERTPAAGALMIPTTDDGCGSSCPNACTTSAA